MAEKFQISAQVIGQREIATDIFDMLLKAGMIAEKARPGQFVNLYCRDSGHLLPRPVSICEADPDKGTLRLVYRVSGAGTREFSRMNDGDFIDMIGPLGNGYPLPDRQGIIDEKRKEPESGSTEDSQGKKGSAAGENTRNNDVTQCLEHETGRSMHIDTSKGAFLLGGGIGIPPLLELSRHLACEKKIILGFRDEQFLTEDLSRYGQVYIATEDGSAGTKGNVLDAVRENALAAGVIYACGPMPMLRAVKKFALLKEIPCYLSLEERMACGIGACLGCVCRTVREDGHSHVKNARVCAEGPVFNALDVDI